MEESDLLKMAGVSTTGIAVLLIVYRIGKYIIGKRLVSNCCGQRFDVGIDIAPMTPKMRENPMLTSVASHSQSLKQETGLSQTSQQSSSEIPPV